MEFEFRIKNFNSKFGLLIINSKLDLKFGMLIVNSKLDSKFGI